MNWTILFCLLSVVSEVVSQTGFAFHLPGSSPVTYCKDTNNNTELWKSDIPVWVNRLNSEQTVIPYEYQHFDFCTIEGAESPIENLGQIILGNHIQPSPYNLRFLHDEKCAVACVKNYTGGIRAHEEKLQVLKHGISFAYEHHWIIDNLPVTWCYAIAGGHEYCNVGFYMGCYIKKDYAQQSWCSIDLQMYNKPGSYLYNHVDLVVTYHSGPEENCQNETKKDCGRIISIKITPRSISHDYVDGKLDCEHGGYLEIPSEPLPPGKTLSVAYTYSVRFQKTDTIKWSSRWNYILESMPHTNIQWLSIFNSLIILLFLSGMIVRITIKISKKAVGHTQMESENNTQKESRWKLIEGDVFRPPQNGMMLSVFLGSGVQIFFTSLVTLGFACLGFRPPIDTGSLLCCAIISYICFGIIAGYVSARIYKSFGGEKWKSNVLLTSMLSPGVVFSLLCIMNLIYQSEGSSAAIPSDTLQIILASWFGIAIPLTFIGALFGSKDGAIEHPVSTNEPPRLIPAQRFFARAIPAVILGGILPFGCIFIQLFFILNSLWAGTVYNMFGCLSLVFIILVITCSECTVILCYFHLGSEDYHWWWRSFLTSGFTAFYLLVYCIHYFITKLNIEDATSTFLYFGYTAIMVYLFFLLTGSIGFFACYWFVTKIYRNSTLMDSEENNKIETANTDFKIPNILEPKEWKLHNHLMYPAVYKVLKNQNA